ncbi:MAG: hypothetical protein ACO3G4_09645 [Opitutaceae bacterium]
MSEREFLELLNLYLDREITPADADRLEREIRTDAGRQRTYLQYCRMQRAVRLLGVTDGLRGEDRARPMGEAAPSAVRRSGWVWTGAVAAAAILAFAIAVGRTERSMTHPDARLATEKVRMEPAGASEAATLGLSGDALLLSTFPRTSSAPKVHEDHFNWMRQFQLVSLESRLGAQPLSPTTVAPQPTNPAAPNRPAGAEATEMAAFKFVK